MVVMGHELMAKANHWVRHKIRLWGTPHTCHPHHCSLFKGLEKNKEKKREMEPCMHLPNLVENNQILHHSIDPPPKLMPDGHPVFCHVSFFFVSNLSLFPFKNMSLSNHICVSFKKNTYLRKILCINVILWLNTLTETINNLEIWYMEFVILDLRKLLKN